MNYYQREQARARKVPIPGDLETGRCVTSQDVYNRFNGVLILYKDKPCWSIIDGEKTDTSNEALPYLRVTSMKDSYEWEYVHPNSLDISVRFDSCVGYVNLCDSAIYISRQPWRKTQAGLCLSNCSVYTENGGPYKGYGSSHAYFYGKDYLNAAMLRKYPSWEEALSKTKAKKMNSAAFHHSFAVDHKGKVFFETVECGVVKSDGVSLLPEYRDSVFIMKLTELGVNTNV